MARSSNLTITVQGSPLLPLIFSAIIFLATTLLLFLNLFSSPNVGAVQLGANWLLAPLALAVLFAVAWSRAYRHRPERDPIVVQYQPPESITPAQARYLYTLGCDGRSFVACILNLAKRGILSIGQEADGVYLSERAPGSSSQLNTSAAIPDEEACVLHALFHAHPIAQLKPPSQLLQNQLAAILREKTYSAFNSRPATLLVGLVAMVAIALWMAAASGMLTRANHSLDLSLGSLLAASLFSAGITSSAHWQHNRRAVLLAWRGIYAYRTIPFLLLPLLVIPLFFWLFLRTIAPFFAAVTALLLLVNVFAAPFLMGYSAQGARLLRQLLGFRRFLASTEQDRLNRLSLAGSLPSADLSLLAFAVALDVPVACADRLGMESMIETSLQAFTQGGRI